MARSSTVWLVRDFGRGVIAAYTVKHEMFSAIGDREGYEVARVNDGYLGYQVTLDDLEALEFFPPTYWLKRR